MFIVLASGVFPGSFFFFLTTRSMAIQKYSEATYEVLALGHWPSQGRCESVTYRTIFFLKCSLGLLHSVGMYFIFLIVLVLD